MLSQIVKSGSMGHKRSSMLVWLTLISACALSACATQPPPPVVATCPKLSELPPALMQPPEASNALSELQQALETLVGAASETRPD